MGGIPSSLDMNRSEVGNPGAFGYRKNNQNTVTGITPSRPDGTIPFRSLILSGLQARIVLSLLRGWRSWQTRQT